MNKILTFISVCIVIAMLSTSSCENQSSETETEVESKTNYEYTGGIWLSMEYALRERTIDSCEYIVIFGTQGTNIIHKANCDNQFHKNNQ